MNAPLHRIGCRFVVACLGLFLASTPLHAATIYVSTGGNDAADGLTWATAKRSIQPAIYVARPAGQVWVAAGTYVERIFLEKGVAVYGGFFGSETELSQRDWIANSTVLEGSGESSVVTVLSGAMGDTRIDGFTIRNGRGARVASYTRGGGIYCLSASPTIANNTIIGNIAASGGGIYCEASSATIVNNVIKGNSVPAGASFGGGICCVSSSGLIANNVIVGNSVPSGGGGAISCKSSSPTIAGNAIIGNSAWTGSGIYCELSSSPAIVNNTLVGNGSASGGAVDCNANCLPAMANSIVAFNSSGVRCVEQSASFSHNCVYGNDAYDWSGLADPTGSNGNISVDPRLAALMYGNAHVQPGSPCIDAGDPGAVEAGWLDMDGQSRVFGGGVDIGADESDGTTFPSGPALVVRVRPDGNDSNDGSSWTAAKRTVQAAIDAVAAQGGEVWVGSGTYLERISLRNFVHVYGGFAGAEPQRSGRDWSVHLAILDGSRGGSVVSADGLGYLSSTIDGFVIRNGFRDSATAVLDGGGIYCRSSSLTIANNTITNNSSPWSGAGGGIYCIRSSSRIVNNSITNNNCGTGGGIFCTESRLTIANNVIAGNSASYGGGVSCSYSSVVASHNVICANTAAYGGGVYCYWSSSLDIASSTIAGNSAPTGGAVYCAAELPPNDTSIAVENTIIAFNSSGIHNAKLVSVSLGSCCVYGNGQDDFSGLPDPRGTNGNIGVDPQFAGLPYGDLHIQATSPCVNAGDDGTVQIGSVDMDGQSRIQGASVDIGADESDGTQWAGEPRVIVRVSPEGDDSYDGSSWALAKRTVQAAIDAATVGGEVWVRAGAYQECIALRTFVHVYGGFAGLEERRSERDPLANQSVLDGGQAGGVVTASRVGSGTLDGLTIRNGKGNGSGSGGTYTRYGGGVYCSWSSVTIASNTIEANTAPDGGSGIYVCNYSSPTIRGNLLRGNVSPIGACEGGTICCSSSSVPTIVNNVISGNSSQHGAGIFCKSGAPVILNNIISGNAAYSEGGGIKCYQGTPWIVSNRIVGNRATSGGGIACTAGSPTIVNNAIVRNTSTSYGGGVYVSYADTTIANTIVAMNSSGIYRAAYLSPHLRYNCIHGNTAYNYSGLPDPTGSDGNLSTDPRFVRQPSPGPDSTWGTADDDYGDLRLLPGSPCIDAGNNADVPADSADLDGDGDTAEPLPLDLLGSLRLADDPATADTGAGAAPVVDIGAYEYFCGDISGDAQVDIVDLLTFAGSWPKSAGEEGYDPACDLNADGTVDVTDLLYLAGAWPG